MCLFFPLEPAIAIYFFLLVYLSFLTDLSKENPLVHVPSGEEQSPFVGYKDNVAAFWQICSTVNLAENIWKYLAVENRGKCLKHYLNDFPPILLPTLHYVCLNRYFYIPTL